MPRCSEVTAEAMIVLAMGMTKPSVIPVMPNWAMNGAM